MQPRRWSRRVSFPALALAVLLAVALAAALSTASASHLHQSAQGNEHYQEGRRALDRRDWQAAVDAFERAAEDDALADASLYWQAYAERQRGAAERALELVAELEQRFPNSEWRDDARVLAAEVRGASRVETRTADEDLKLMALNGLMHADDETAIPILEELLESNSSARIKERALFVLAQSDSERAHAILSRTARESGDPDLQTKAIRYLGVHAGERGMALLSELYSSLSEVETRAAVLHALMIAGAQDQLLAVARDEPNEELRSKAIHWLGTMDATNELWELYGRERSDEVRKRILHAFMISDDEEHLRQIARNSREVRELRKAAIHNLGISGRSARPALLEIYRDESDRELKEQVLHALFLQDADSDLVRLARAETDRELLQKAVHWLSLMDSEEARSFMMEILRR